MKQYVNRALILTTVVMGLGCAAPASAQTSQTIDFTTLPGGTPVSTQFAGVSFTMFGGPSADTTPATNIYTDYAPYAGLRNSANSSYPTNVYLDALFTTPVSSVSFTFNNDGDNSSFDSGGSSYTAFAADNSVISSGSLATAGVGDDGAFLQAFNVSGSNIAKLEFFNGRTPGTGASWIYNIGQLSFTSSIAAAAPEPGTWLMMIVGFGLAGAALRSAKRRSDDKFDAKIKKITYGAIA